MYTYHIIDLNGPWLLQQALKKPKGIQKNHVSKCSVTMQYKKGRASQTTSRFDDVDVAGWLETPKKTLAFASD
jgi:hypothetical protein